MSMSYYEAQSWQIPAQQSSWEQCPTPSRTGRPIEEIFTPANRGSCSNRDDFGLAARGLSCFRHSDRRYVLEQYTSSFQHLCVTWFERSQIRAPHLHRGYYLLRIFADVLLEVNRALDNLNKSGKLFSLPSRRDSMPIMGGARAFSDFGAHGYKTPRT